MLDSEAYFIFDSEHIESIAPRLYGFYVTKDGLFTSYSTDDISDSTGAWILVRQNDDGLVITQDSLGCFGLFLFRSGTYWALSNSFNHLLDFLKTKHKLTFNKDYADAFLSQQVCIAVYGETIIQEIAWLDRRAVVLVNKSDASLSVSLRRLAEKTIGVATEHGMSILDAWHDKWASFVGKAVHLWPGTIQVDLSGGFDTRMVLAPVLSSGVEFNRISFCSKPKHEEDFRIASLIADEYGFVLNDHVDTSFPRPVPCFASYTERALQTILFEKEIHTPLGSQERIPALSFSGAEAAIVRSYWWDLSYSDYVKKLLILPSQSKLVRLFRRLKPRLGEDIVRRSFAAIDHMLGRLDSSHEMGLVNGQQYYTETRSRSHNTMSIARAFLSQSYIVAPLLDPLILSLRGPAKEGHPMLLTALIFTRYHEKLASYPIERNRHIPEETLRLAREINERFPRKAFNIQESNYLADAAEWELLQPVVSNACFGDCSTMQQPISEHLKQAFESSVVQDIAKKLYGTSVQGLIDPNRDARHPDANKYAFVAIAKVYEDVRLGKDAPKDFAAFLEACC